MHMFGIYEQVVARGLPNFLGACIPLPTNPDIPQWNMVTVTPEDKLTVIFLQFGFPTGYQGPVPSPYSANHVSADAHLKDIATCVTTELAQGAMLGPFDNPPSLPGVRSTFC